VIVMFKPGGAEGNGSRSVEQCVPLVWTRCHLGGARPWFHCVAYVGGRLCGRRVVKLYPTPRFSRADIAAAWRMRANGRSRAIAPSAGCTRSGCTLVGAPISSKRFPKDRTECTGGPTIGYLPGLWRRTSARSRWSKTICVGAFRVSCAVRMSPGFEAQLRSRPAGCSPQTGSSKLAGRPTKLGVRGRMRVPAST
jgi:hypothetical protein